MITIIGWRHAIVWTNAVILLIGTLGTNFIEILIEINISSFLLNFCLDMFASMC